MNKILDFQVVQVGIYVVISNLIAKTRLILLTSDNEYDNGK